MLKMRKFINILRVYFPYFSVYLATTKIAAEMPPNLKLLATIFLNLSTLQGLLFASYFIIQSSAAYFCKSYFMFSLGNTVILPWPSAGDLPPPLSALLSHNNSLSVQW